MKTENDRIKLNFNIQLKKYFEDLCNDKYNKGFKNLYKTIDEYDNSIEKTLDYDLFYENYIENNSISESEINKENLKEYFSIDKILDLHSLTIINNLQVEIDDFLNENRFLTQTMNLKDDLKSISSKKLIEDITVNQITKCIYLYKKSRNQLNSLIYNINDLKDKELEESNEYSIFYLDAIKNDSKFLSIKRIWYSLNPLNQKIPEYISKYSKFEAENKIYTNKITTLNNKIETLKKLKNNIVHPFLKEYSSDLKEIKQEIYKITKDNQQFQNKINQFEDQKKLSNELSNYDPELSAIFNEAVGNKTDYIMKNLNNMLSIFKDGLLNYEDTLLTKTSQAMVKIHPVLRVKDIEGKTLPEYLKSMAIKIGVKKTLILSIGLLSAMVNGQLHITDKINQYSMNNHNQVQEILTSIKDKNSIDIDLTKVNNFDDVYKVVNNLNFDNLDIQKCFEITKINFKNETNYEINKQSQILDI